MGLALSGLTGKKESKAVQEYHLGQDHTKRLGHLEITRDKSMQDQQWLPGSHTSVLGLRLVQISPSQHLKINRVLLYTLTRGWQISQLWHQTKLQVQSGQESITLLLLTLKS